MFSVAAVRSEAFTVADRKFIDVCADIISLVNFLIEAFEKAAELRANKPALISKPEDADDDDNVVSPS